MGGTASVSCVDSTSSGYQVILLQPYDLTVVNVRPGEKQTVPVVPSGRYCILELPMGEYNDFEVKCSREFIAEDITTLLSTIAIIGINIASKLVSALSVHVYRYNGWVHVLYDLYYLFCHNYSWCCGTVHIHDIDHSKCGYYQQENMDYIQCCWMVSSFTRIF